MKNDDQFNLVKTESITHSASWNLLGQAVPLIIGIATLPLIIRGLGTERFGLFTLMTAAYVYFNVLDFGLNFALVHHLSRKLKKKDSEGASALVWTALTLLAVVSAAAMVLLFFGFHWFLPSLHLGDVIALDARTAFYVLLMVIPLSVLCAAMRAVLQACHRFDLINKIQVPFGVAGFLFPVVALQSERTLTAVLWALAVAHILALVSYVLVIRRVMPYLMAAFKISMADARLLFSFGGWLMVSNVLNPLMMYSDRFLLGMTQPVQALMYYTTPQDSLAKLLIIPASVSAPLFSRFSVTDGANTAELFSFFVKGVKFVFILLFPLVAGIFVFAPEILTLWLGKDFGAHSSVFMRWFAMSMLVYGFSYIASHLIIGVGRTDWSARMHLIEFPVYIVLLIFLVGRYEFYGAVAAFFVRIFIEMIIFFALVVRLLALPFQAFAKNFGVIIVFILSLFVAPGISGAGARGIFLGAVLSVFCGVVWKILLTSEDKVWMRFLIGNLSKRDQKGHTV